MDELWKPVVGYEDCYEVSTHGRVWSKTRKRADGLYVKRGRLLTLTRDSGGYMCVKLCRMGKPKRRLVHQLVLEAFVGPKPEGQMGCHNNGERDDNRLENLRWDTCKANHEDRERHGRAPQGERNGESWLTEIDIERMFDLNRYANQHQIGDWLGVNQSNVSSVLRGKSWKHLGYKPQSRGRGKARHMTGNAPKPLTSQASI